MKLIFLGSGCASVVSHNYHSNMLLVNESQKTLLVDCGSDIRRALHEFGGLTHKNIQAVYISHLHADHTGGLEWLAFNTKFDPDCQKPVLYINEDLVEDLWNKVLAGGLSSLSGVVADLSDYFEVEVIKNRKFNWQGLEMNLIKTLHTMSGSNLMPSYGLYFRVNEKNVLITTDTRFNLNHFKDFYNKADIIFHDCETDSHRSGVHANYEELLTLDPQIKKKIWLYHYNQNKLPNAEKEGFRGFVKRGQSFDFNNFNSI